MTDVVMPQMGESIAEGTVTRWLKKVGDSVERDQPLLEISTDKVDAEIPAPTTGVLSEILVTEGTTVAIQTVLARIADPSEARPEPPSAPQVAAQPAPQPPPPVPPASQAPPPPEVAPPAAVEAPAEADAPPPTAEAPAEEPPAQPSPLDELRRTRSSPLVRRIAQEHSVELSAIRGTGLGGRVTKEDILEHIQKRLREEAFPPPPPSAPEPPPTAEKPAPPPTPAPRPPAPTAPVVGPRDRLVPMSPIRRRTAEHMSASRRTAAHATTLFEVDMTRVEQLRTAHRRAYQEQGVPLTFLPFILKATVGALKAHPILNARVDGESIIYHHDINIGIAVALERGLIVPVIRHADEKNVLALARSVFDLVERARSKHLTLDEVQGGTFTVTNPGVFGSLFGTPIIHQPQVAILALGVVEKRPVVRDDAIAVRSMAYFALSFDHRVIDGADADRFMAQIKRDLQDFDESAL